MFRQWNLFRRLYVSYILITLLPVSLLFMLLYKNSVIQLRAEVESFTVANLARIKEAVDLRIRECKSIAGHIGMNPKLSYSNMAREDYRVLEGIEELGKYKAGNAFLSDVLVYYKNGQRLFSSKGMTSVDVLTERAFGFGREERLGFYAQLEQLESPVLKAYPASDLLIYMVPLPLTGGVQTGTALFVFQGSLLRNMISQGKTEFSGATYIMDAGKRTLFTIHRPGQTPDYAGLPALLEPVGTGIHVIDYKEERLSVVAAASDETGWTYVTVIPTAQFLARVNSQELFITASTIVIVLLCAMTALPLALSHYRPIRRLHEWVKAYMPHVEAQSNEIEHIRSAVDTTLTLNQSLLHQLGEQRSFMRQSALLRLLQGAGKLDEEELKYIEASGLRLDGPGYAVVLAQYEPGDDEAPLYNGKALEEIGAMYSNRGVAYAVEGPGGHSIAVVLNVREPGDRAERLALADAVLERFPPHVRPAIRVGAGRAYDELAKLPLSYMEAFAAVSQTPAGAMASPRPALLYEELEPPTATNGLPAEEQLYLLHSLKQGDRALALDAVDRMLREMAARQLPPSYVRYGCYKLCDIALKAAQELPSAPEERPDGKALLAAMHQALGFTSPGDFAAQLRPLIDLICDAVAAVNEKRDHSLIAHVLAFVGEHYRDPNMSLEAISARFGYSNYYWSRFFKEKINCHFSEYLWRLRVEEAKRQLVGSTQTIKDIVTNVGYIDLTSFIRKFKNEEGITPGQFRKLYASAGES